MRPCIANAASVDYSHFLTPARAQRVEEGLNDGFGSQVGNPSPRHPKMPHNTYEAPARQEVRKGLRKR